MFYRVYILEQGLIQLWDKFSGIECDDGDGFEDGIVNGAFWYPVLGILN